MTAPPILVEKAKRLYDLKNRKDELEEELKGVNRELEMLQVHQIPALMEDQDTTSIKIVGVGTIYTQQKVKASIIADVKSEAYDWLSENGHGDLIKDYVHPKTLEAWAKEQLENNMPIPEQFIRAYKYTQAMIRRG